MAKSERSESVERALKAAGGNKARTKGTPAKKKTPAWNRYKTENRAFTHQVKQIEKHLRTHPTDKQSQGALQRIRDRRYTGVK